MRSRLFVGGDHPACPRQLGLGGVERPVDDRYLGGVDARLAAQAQRAGEPALGLECLVGSDVEVHDVERCPQTGGDRVEHQLRPHVDQLEAVGAWLQADLGAEVDGADLERGDSPS